MDVTKLHSRPIASETDVSGFACDARMRSAICRFVHRVQIHIQDQHAIKRHLDYSSYTPNFLMIPLVDRLKLGALRCYDSPNRTVVVMSGHILVRRVIEDLNFDAHIGWIS